MAKFIVEGGVPLCGEIQPAGNKNEALPILAATLLSDREVTLENVPGIGDVSSLLALLDSCGASIEQSNDRQVRIKAESIESPVLPPQLCKKNPRVHSLIGPVAYALQKSGKFPSPAATASDDAASTPTFSA